MFNKAGYAAQDAPSMRFFTFQNNTGQTDGRTGGQTYGRTDTTSYRDAQSHLKTKKITTGKKTQSTRIGDYGDHRL